MKRFALSLLLCAACGLPVVAGEIPQPKKPCDPAVEVCPSSTTPPDDDPSLTADAVSLLTGIIGLLLP